MMTFSDSKLEIEIKTTEVVTEELADVISDADYLEITIATWDRSFALTLKNLKTNVVQVCPIKQLSKCFGSR